MAISAQALLPVVATVEGEGANQDYKTKVKIASTILNRFESGKKEFGAEDGSISKVLNHGYDSFRNQTPVVQQVLSGKYGDPIAERSAKESLGIVSGLVKGAIPRDKAQFFMTPKAAANLAKSKKFDFKKVVDVGKSGAFNFYAYPDANPVQ